MRPWTAAPLVAFALHGCAITALVGENPDAAAPADRGASVDFMAVPIDVVVVPMDAAVAPTDVVAPMDVPRATDNEAVRPDTDFRDRPLATLDARAVPDTPLGIGDGAPSADVGGTIFVDAEPAIDAMQTLPDASLGAPCRRDLDCASDPTRRFCSLSFQRCAAMP